MIDLEDAFKLLDKANLGKVDITQWKEFYIQVLLPLFLLQNLCPNSLKADCTRPGVHRWPARPLDRVAKSGVSNLREIQKHLAFAMFHDAWPRYRQHFDDVDKDKDGFLNLQV